MDVVYETIATTAGLEVNSLRNQMLIIYLVMAVGGQLMYASIASCSFFYFFVYKKQRYYPPTVKDSEVYKQVSHEIYMALCSIPLIAVPMMPSAVLSYRGYGKMYKNVSDYGWPYFFLSIILFFLFTDCLVYFAHRGLHHPLLYRPIHKLHHTYRYTTPFSSHAFHPMDGFGQGVPYYIATFVMPLHNWLFMGLFFTVNLWTISIHDQVDFGGHFLNSTGHHTIHHVDFNYNYGQYTTLWDRICGTYKPAIKTHNAPRTLEELLAPEM